MKTDALGVLVISSICIHLCLGLTAAAANDDKAQTTQTPADKTAKTSAPSPPPPTTAADMPAVLVDDRRLESVLGKEIHSSSGEMLGVVTDILVDSDGTVRAAIIDFGGFLGVGVRKIAVAWPALHFVQGESAIAAVLSMNKDQLRVAPEYHAGEPIVIIGGETKPAQSSTPNKK